MNLLRYCFFFLLVFGPFATAEERVARLEAHTQQWQSLHDDFESSRKEHAVLLDHYKDLDRKYGEIAKEINHEEAAIARLRNQKQPEIDNKGKKNPGADRKNDQIDRDIKVHQKKIGDIKEKLSPLRKEAEQVSNQGKKVEKEGLQIKASLWLWRHEWCDRADLMLQESSDSAKEFLEQLKKRDLRGPMGDAWQLARAAALAATEDYPAALAELDPLLKNEVWEAKAAALQAHIRLKLGKMSDCESSWKRALRADNDDPHAFLVRGLQAVQEKKLYDAERYFELAITHYRANEKHYRSIAKSVGVEVVEGKEKK